jgi:hypothetical protein
MPLLLVAVITMDVTSSLAPMTLQEGQPILWLVAAGFLMAMILLLPAAIEAAWRGCLVVGRLFVRTAVRHRPESRG